MWEVTAAEASEVTGVSSSPLSSSSAGSSSSASPPASANLAGVAGGGSLVGLQHGGHQYQRRKQSRNFPGLVKRSHMGSLASIVAGSGGGQEGQGGRRPSYGRSASVAASAASSRSRRPSSLHLPVTQTLSASSAMVSPILSVATRAINNNFMEAAELTKIGHSGGSGSKSIPYPPLIFPAAEFAPGNHLPKQGHRLGPVPTKGENLLLTITMQIHSYIIGTFILLHTGSSFKYNRTRSPVKGRVVAISEVARAYIVGSIW